MQVVRPLASVKLMKIEAFNDVMVLLSIYTMICFTPWIPDAKVKSRIGFIACTLVALHFIVSLVFITASSVSNLIQKCKIRQAKKVQEKQRVKLRQRLAKAKALREYKRSD